MWFDHQAAQTLKCPSAASALERENKLVQLSKRERGRSGSDGPCFASRRRLCTLPPHDECGTKWQPYARHQIGVSSAQKSSLLLVLFWRLRAVSCTSVCPLICGSLFDDPKAGIRVNNGAAACVVLSHRVRRAYSTTNRGPETVTTGTKQAQAASRL